MTRIETERLTLKPLTVSDAPAVFKWVGDERVNKFMLYSLYTSVSEVEKWISSIPLSKHEFGFFLKDGTLIGAGSVHYNSEYRAYEIGYNLNADFWGKGYATEGAKALIAWAKEELSAKNFVAVYAAANTASKRVLEKCGFTFWKNASYSRYDGSETFPAVVCRLSF